MILKLHSYSDIIEFYLCFKRKERQYCMIYIFPFVKGRPGKWSNNYHIHVSFQITRKVGSQDVVLCTGLITWCNRTRSFAVGTEYRLTGYHTLLLELSREPYILIHIDATFDATQNSKQIWPQMETPSKINSVKKMIYFYSLWLSYHKNEQFFYLQKFDVLLQRMSLNVHINEGECLIASLYTSEQKIILRDL